MRTADLTRAALATVDSAALATGCTSTTEGAADSSATAPEAPVEIFNPCSELPDQVVTDVGLDPTTKNVVTDPPSGPSSWRVCAWRTPDDLVRITILSTSHTLDEARNREDTVQKVETTVGSRPALQAQDGTETDGRSCYTSMEADQGMFETKASWFEEGGWSRDICEVSGEFATVMDPHLPK